MVFKNKIYDQYLVATDKENFVEGLDTMQREALYTDTASHYNRVKHYPSIEDQLDMIFHAGLGGDEFQAAIQAVKDAYPKPE